MNYTAIKRYLLMLAVTLVSIATVFLYASFQYADNTPVFSAESGFYDEPFYLEITAPEGYDIYYTLDSSTPDILSTRYTEPIYIGNASSNENVYTSHPNLTGTFPKALVDKCTVVRAIAVPKLLPIVGKNTVITKSFFVGYPQDHFDNSNIISLVTDPDNLFDNKIGIYVEGDIMSKFLAQNENPTIKYYHWPSNYSQRGKDWEREANATFWDADRTLLLNKDIGIRIQGGTTRCSYSKSLNLFSRIEYDGNANFETDFFDTSLSLSKLTLSTGGNAFLSKINDYLLFKRLEKIGFDTMAHQPYVLFLDGEYWGFYWLTEAYNGDYLRETYDLGNEDVIIIKHGAVEEGIDSDLAAFQQMQAYFESTDMSIDSNYEQACALIDIDNFIDYHAALIYIARSYDWPVSNEAMWRTRNTSGAQFADGKWRWLLFDCNGFCMEANLTEHNTLQYVIETSVIFRSLWNSPLFREAFEKRIMEIADQCFCADEMYAFIEEYRQTMYEPLRKHWERFYEDDNSFPTEFMRKLDDHQFFFANRRDVVSWFS